MSRRSTGRAVPAAERMRRWRAARRARGLKACVTWVAPPERAPLPPPELRLLEARTLALCVMTVEKINRQPALLEIVHGNFARWQERGRCAPGESVRAWRKLLRLPWPQVAARLTQQSPQGVRLRSVAPLFGVLTAWERRRINDAFRLARPRSSGTGVALRPGLIR